MINPNSQAGRLLSHLQTGNTITRLSSFIELGICELSARCIDLERQGYKIEKKRIKVQNRFGEQVSVTEYSINEGN
jgi:hypothetical protein